MTAAFKGKKRRRSTSSVISETGAATASHAVDYSDIEALLHTRLSAHKQEVAEQHKAHRAEVMQLLANHKIEIAHLLTTFQTELVDRLDRSEARVRDEIEDKLTELVDEKVAEQVAEVQDSIMDSLTSMPLRAELTFPDHPQY